MTQLKMEPYFNRLFVIREKAQERSAGGVLKPESGMEKPNRGVVAAAGPECKSSWVGQNIIFGQNHGLDITIDGQEYTILREDDVYAGDKMPSLTWEERKRIDEVMKETPQISIINTTKKNPFFKDREPGTGNGV